MTIIIDELPHQFIRRSRSHPTCTASVSRNGKHVVCGLEEHADIHLQWEEQQERLREKAELEGKVTWSYVEPGLYKCKMCGAQYDTRGLLSQHLVLEHLTVEV